MKRSLIVDAVNIRFGGGKVLLQYFVQYLAAQSINVKLLVNKSIPKDFLAIEPAESLGSNQVIKRERFFRSMLWQHPEANIFCFGNFPPMLNYSTKVFVYFHNANLYKDNGAEPFAKKWFLRRTLKNADHFIFQTSLTRDKFLEKYPFPRKETSLYPFYVDTALKQQRAEASPKVANSFIYNSLPYPHKGHAEIFRAWLILAEQGLFPTLHVTCPAESMAADLEIPSLSNIINHGFLPHSNLLSLMASCEFCIFPSHSESFGLGLMEATYLQCKVVAVDLPYVHEVIKPSRTFAAQDVDGIVAEVKGAITNGFEGEAQSHLLVNNEVAQLTTFLLNARQ